MLHKINTNLMTFKSCDTFVIDQKNHLKSPKNENINNLHHENHKLHSQTGQKPCSTSKTLSIF
jgi:hypothetical protein